MLCGHDDGVQSDTDGDEEFKQGIGCEHVEKTLQLEPWYKTLATPLTALAVAVNEDSLRFVIPIIQILS